MSAQSILLVLKWIFKAYDNLTKMPDRSRAFNIKIHITIAILPHHKGGVSSSRLGIVCKPPLLSLRSVG